MPDLLVKTAPTGDVVSLAEAKEWLGLDTGFTVDDALVTDLIEAGVTRCEQIMSNPILNTAYYWFLDDWPRSRSFRMPRHPVVSIDAIEYIADGDTTHTYVATGIGATDWHTEVTLGLARWDEEFTPPDLRKDDLLPVRVDFTAGHGATSATVPEAIRAAVRLAVGLMHGHRRGDHDRNGERALVDLLAQWIRPHPTLGNTG